MEQNFGLCNLAINNSQTGLIADVRKLDKYTTSKSITLLAQPSYYPQWLLSYTKSTDHLQVIGQKFKIGDKAVRCQ